MPVHTIAYVDWAFEVESFELDAYKEDYNECLEEEDDALVSSTWIENLKGLKLTAGAVLFDTIIVSNVEEAELAFKQESGVTFHRPRKIMLKGYSDAVHCRFKHFLDLSYELRQKIWDFAMRAEVHSYCLFHLQDRLEVRNYVRKNTIGTSARNPSFLPKACRVSKFTQRETLEVFLRGTMFQICAIEQNQFMHSFFGLAPKGFQSVRRLQFAFFDCFPAGFSQNADLELAVRCPGVKELQLSFHDNKLCSVNGNHTVTPRPAQEMWDYYRMARLLDFGVRFEKVTILRKGRGNRPADRAALELARFVMLKFREEKGRQVEARVSGNKFVQSLGD